MVKLIWTDQAIEDLNNIGEYISENSERYAQLTVKRLFERTFILKEFPLIGRVVPERNDKKIRELIEGNYRIIYEVNSDSLLYILTIYHSSRNLKV